MEIIAERAAAAYAETLEATTSIQVFGTPSDDTSAHARPVATRKPASMHVRTTPLRSALPRRGTHVKRSKPVAAGCAKSDGRARVRAARGISCARSYDRAR